MKNSTIFIYGIIVTQIISTIAYCLIDMNILPEIPIFPTSVDSLLLSTIMRIDIILIILVIARVKEMSK